MFAILGIDPSGHSRTFRSCNEASSVLGLSNETIRRIAKAEGYTRTGWKLSIIGGEANRRNRRKQVSTNINPELHARLVAHSERVGGSLASVACELLERAIVERIPLVG